MTDATCPVHADRPAVGTCPRCGQFVCAECATAGGPEAGHCSTCSDLLALQRRRRAFRRWQIAVMGSAAGLPVTGAVALGILRPDLWLPMLDHIFGYVLLLAVLLLLAIQAAVLFFGYRRLNRRAVELDRSSTGSTIGLTAASVIFCTLPVAFALLFGPIVFTLVFGAVE